MAQSWYPKSLGYSMLPSGNDPKNRNACFWQLVPRILWIISLLLAVSAGFLLGKHENLTGPFGLPPGWPPSPRAIPTEANCFQLLVRFKQPSFAAKSTGRHRHQKPTKRGLRCIPRDCQEQVYLSIQMTKSISLVWPCSINFTAW